AGVPERFFGIGEPAHRGHLVSGAGEVVPVNGAGDLFVVDQKDAGHGPLGLQWGEARRQARPQPWRITSAEGGCACCSTRGPPGLGEAASALLRGAVLHEGKLYLELAVERLSPRAPLRLAPLERPVVPLGSWVERALVFESGGRRFGVPLGLVSQVVQETDAF